MLIKNKKWKNLSMLILTLTVIVFVFEIIPRGVGVFELLFELYTNNNKVERSSEIDIELKQLNLENTTVKKEIESLVTHYDDSRQISSVLAALEEISTLSGCEINTIKPAEPEVKKNLRVQSLELLINGSYENLYNFLRFTEKSSKVMIINSVDISPVKTGKSGLQMFLNIEVYLNL